MLVIKFSFQIDKLQIEPWKTIILESKLSGNRLCASCLVCINHKLSANGVIETKSLRTALTADWLLPAVPLQRGLGYLNWNNQYKRLLL